MLTQPDFVAGVVGPWNCFGSFLYTNIVHLFSDIRFMVGSYVFLFGLKPTVNGRSAAAC